MKGKNKATGDTGTPTDFISFHAKGQPKHIDGRVQMGISNQLRDIDRAFAVIARYPEFADTPIVIGESDPEGCAACQGPHLAYRNGTMYSSYTAASFPRKLDLADKHGVNLEGSLTWAFEFEDQPYFAGFRSLATNGIDKPVLNVFRMFSKMDGRRLPVISVWRNHRFAPRDRLRPFPLRRSISTKPHQCRKDEPSAPQHLIEMNRFFATGLLAFLAAAPLHARQWVFKGVREPVKAEFVAESNGYVVLHGPNGASFELPLASFSDADREFIRLLGADPAAKKPIPSPGKPLTRKRDYKATSVKTIESRMVVLDEPAELHVTGPGDPLTGSSFNFTHPDGWLFLNGISPSEAASEFLDRMLINGAPAKLDENVRVVRHAGGAVIIPHGPDFPALTLFSAPNLGGGSISLKCYVPYGAEELGKTERPAASFLLKRGYMATLAENEDGTGVSRNYVAQDHDIVIERLPEGLDKGVRFVRVFPWRWTNKKGIAGGIHEKLNVGWFYDWNIGARSDLDLEYVAIKQKRWWPGMNQDWKYKGINHLLGFNEPDRPDQAKMTVDEAIAGWPELLRTGLRLGSPAPSDGGLGWLYEFMDKADKAGLRVDYVAVHYYRGVGDPDDPKAAANQMLGFLQRVHDRVKRPLWVTEWNNGANWTNTPQPNEKQQKRAIQAMIDMLDETPFVERYALYNWVQDGRKLLRDDGSLTPAGEVYRDKKSPVFFVQPAYQR